jgi:hypothetical protein
MLALGVGQAIWLVDAGESIRHVNPNTYVRGALGYVARHPETRFRLSPQVQAIASGRKMTIPPNVSKAKDVDELVFFAKTEGPGWSGKSNDPFQAKAVYGPHEVNFDWYSTWMGNDRVVIMTLEKAKASKVPVAQ